MSINCLEHFASVDPHARQYVLISQTLLETTKKHAQDRRITQKRLRREATSNLFGLLPTENDSTEAASVISADMRLQSSIALVHLRRRLLFRIIIPAERRRWTTRLFAAGTARRRRLVS